MFFLATCDADGNPQCSYKGGNPGFVRVLDDRTLAFPVYDGNGMFLSLGNIRGQAHVGMLFIDFEQPNRLRVNGVATVDEDDPLRAEFDGRDARRPSADHAGVSELRPVHPQDAVGRALRVRADGRQPTPPIPDWKRMTWAQEHLPDGDPARGTARTASADGRTCSGRRASAGGPYARRPEPTASARGATSRCGR